jgi:hypothetical protein
MKFYDSRKLNWRNSWFMYKKTHVLAEQHYKIKRGREFFLSEFLKNITGTSLSIDSFYPGTINYEFEHAIPFWSAMFDTTPTFIGDYRDINTDLVVDNVVALGQQLFRYKTITECIEQLIYLKKFTKKFMFVCLPIQTIQYHRLAYSKTQIIDHILAESNLQQIDMVADSQYNNVYLWIMIKT